MSWLSSYFTYRSNIDCTAAIALTRAGSFVSAIFDGRRKTKLRLFIQCLSLHDGLVVVFLWPMRSSPNSSARKASGLQGLTLQSNKFTGVSPAVAGSIAVSIRASRHWTKRDVYLEPGKPLGDEAVLQKGISQSILSRHVHYLLIPLIEAPELNRRLFFKSSSRTSYP
jgi:hypothetical protein